MNSPKHEKLKLLQAGFQQFFHARLQSRFLEDSNKEDQKKSRVTVSLRPSKLWKSHFLATLFTMYDFINLLAVNVPIILKTVH